MDLRFDGEIKEVYSMDIQVEEDVYMEYMKPGTKGVGIYLGWQFLPNEAQEEMKQLKIDLNITVSRFKELMLQHEHCTPEWWHDGLTEEPEGWVDTKPEGKEEVLDEVA